MTTKKSLKFNLLLSLLLSILQFTSANLAQQEERLLQPQLTRDHSLFPLQSTGIWTEVHPLIPRVDYWGVDFVNEDTGWAVGEGGAIIKTTNGGHKWIWYESGVENTLRTVSAVNNGQRVIAAGDGGMILISEDAGETWNTIPSGTTDNIWNMQMITDEIGWMVGEGGTALKSTNGGLNWIQQPMPYPTAPYWDVSFIDTSFGYICSAAGIVLKTTNGGGDWQIQQAGDTRALWTIYALDTLRASGGGFAGKVVYTTDGGNNWLYATGTSTSANKIKFINDSTGFMAANGGFAESTDGGITWFTIYDLYQGSDSSPSTNISFPPGTNGYVTGMRMLLAKTTDQGVNWRRTIINADLINVYFKDENNGFMNSSQFIYTTDDGGHTLDTLKTFPYGEIYLLGAMTFTDSLTGYISKGLMRIYKTIDGGVNWYPTNITGLIDTLGSIKKIFFYDQINGWAVSSRGCILGTFDGGENWYVQLDAGINVIFQSIFFIDSLVGWTANVNRRPYKTTDGGNSWLQQTNLSIYNSYDIYFKDFLKGWILSEDKLFRTTNGGDTWFQDTQISASTSRFKTISESHFIITPSIYESVDAGNTWNNVISDVGTSFSNLYAPYEYFCVPIGTRGLVINYMDTSIVSVKHSFEYNPSTVDLKQNYPNPFNPTTKIEYTIPQTDNPLLGVTRGGLVSLKVYDILGREVATLVSEEKPAGNYEVEFDASGLPSGIYFYQFKAANFIKTKKMILLR